MSASSVVRMMSGSIISAIVSAPPSSEFRQPHISTKNIRPKIPYTIDGMPESVSAATRTILTKMFVDFAYSTMKIAAKMPMTPATTSEMPAIVSVLMSEGSIDMFDGDQRIANISAVRCGTPCMNT